MFLVCSLESQEDHWPLLTECDSLKKYSTYMLAVSYLGMHPPCDVVSSQALNLSRVPNQGVSISRPCSCHKPD